MPANLTFEQAAAVPLAALTALQGLRDKGRIQPGHKVLITGASGGVGTFAVQIAKSFGADVTAVVSTKNTELVCSIGADQVIDYTCEDYLKFARRFDLMLDLAATRPPAQCRRVPAPRLRRHVESHCAGHPAPLVRRASEHGRSIRPTPAAFTSSPVSAAAGPRG